MCVVALCILEDPLYIKYTCNPGAFVVHRATRFLETKKLKNINIMYTGLIS